MQKIIIYDREPRDHIDRWLIGLVKYLQNKGFKIEPCFKNRIPDFNNCKLLIIWNGTEEVHKPILNKARQENIKILFIECGFFPQSKYFYVDEKGINADASIMDDNFSWITQEHMDKLQPFRQAYLEGRKWNQPGKYILCPLQIPTDTNIIKNSPFKDMQSFINHVEEKFPNEFILFKNHPLTPNINYKIKGSNALIKNGSFLDYAQDAKLIYGLTSTSLLESTMLNVPTESIGTCWLNKHKENKEKLLAALIEKQIPVGQENLDKWIGKYLD